METYREFRSGSLCSFLDLFIKQGVPCNEIAHYHGYILAFILASNILNFVSTPARQLVGFRDYDPLRVDIRSSFIGRFKSWDTWTLDYALVNNQGGMVSLAELLALESTRNGTGPPQPLSPSMSQSNMWKHMRHHLHSKKQST
jgi:hypothetical protein